MLAAECLAEGGEPFRDDAPPGPFPAFLASAWWLSLWCRPCGPGETAHVGELPGEGFSDLASERLDLARGQVRIDPAFEFYPEGSSCPSGSGVGVDDAGDIPGGCFGGGDDGGVDAVSEAVHDVAGDFVADMADESGDGYAGHRVSPSLAEFDGDEPDEGAGGGGHLARSAGRRR